MDRCSRKWCDKHRIRYVCARCGVEWSELYRDGTRNGEYTGEFHGCNVDGVGVGVVARTGEYGVLGLGSRDHMGREAVDGDGARDKHGGVFDQWTQLARMRCKCL